MEPTKPSRSQHTIPPILYAVAAVLLAARVWYAWWGT